LFVRLSSTNAAAEWSISERLD